MGVIASVRSSSRLAGIGLPLKQPALMCRDISASCSCPIHQDYEQGRHTRLCVLAGALDHWSASMSPAAPCLSPSVQEVVEPELHNHDLSR